MVRPPSRGPGLRRTRRAQLPAHGRTPQRTGEWVHANSARPRIALGRLVATAVLAIAALGALYPAKASTDTGARMIRAVPGWTTTATMSATRVWHSASLLANGSVLIVGGENVGGALAGAQLFDPSTGEWWVAPSTNPPRTLMGTTLLDDGTVVLTGGHTNASPFAVATVQRYEPAAARWVADGQLLTGRYRHTASKLNTGKLLITGGLDAVMAHLRSAERFDPVAQTSTPVPDMAESRYDHAAAVLKDGKVLISGGYGLPSGATPLGSAETYDPVTNKWTQEPGMGVPRAGHTATVLRDGTVLVVGGKTTNSQVTAAAELFVPEQDDWFPTGPLITGRMAHQATLLDDGRVLVTGGDSPSGFPLASAEVYDPARGTWAAAGSMLTGRLGHTATRLPDGRVLVTGGQAAQGPTSTAEIWTPDWTTSVTGDTNVDFNDVGVGTSSPLLSVSVTNTGSSPLLASNPFVGGPNAAEFILVGETCTRAPVIATKSCQFVMRFDPSDPGTRTATLTYQANTPTSPRVVSLNGRGTVPATPTPSPTVTETPSPTPSPTVSPPESTPGPLPTVAPPRPTATPVPRQPSKIVVIDFDGAYRTNVAPKAKACRAGIVATIQRGKRVLDRRRTRIDGHCKYHVRFRVRRDRIGRRKSLTVVVHFLGNRYLGATTNKFTVSVPA